MAKRKVRDIRRAEPEAEQMPRVTLAAGATAMTVLPPDVEAVEIGDGFAASIHGLTVRGQPTFEQCEHAGERLRVFERVAPLVLGDFLVYIEDRFGEEAAQIVDASTGWSLKTCSMYRWLSRSVAPDVRRLDKLGARHHMAVAKYKLSPGKQREWLNRAADSEDEPWTVARLEAALRENEDLPEIAWWVTAMATSAEDQAALTKQLEQAGRVVKPGAKRGKTKGGEK